MTCPILRNKKIHQYSMIFISIVLFLYFCIIINMQKIFTSYETLYIATLNE